MRPSLATTTIPLVMVTSGDPVGFGFVASLARPGGNITGFEHLFPGTQRETARPAQGNFAADTQPLAVLLNPDNSINDRNLPAMERTAQSLKIELQRFEVRGPDEFKDAFSAMTKQRVDAVALPEDDFLDANRSGIAELVAKERLPSIGRTEFAEAGCVIGYGETPPTCTAKRLSLSTRFEKARSPPICPWSSR